MIRRPLALALLAVATAASGQEIFKYRMPDGRIVYSDKHVPNATLVEAFEGVPAPDPAAAAARQEAVRAQVKAANERAEARVQALNAISAEIAAATAELERARAALESGREPLEGERIGTYAGRARLNDAYWDRQAENEQAVADAQTRLDRARNALIQIR